MKVKQFAYSFLGTVIRMVILVILAIVLYRLGGKAYEFGFRIFTEPPMSEEPGRDVQITVAKSDSASDVADMLEEKGLVKDSFLFRVQMLLATTDGDIHPGIFTLNTSMTAEEMCGILLEKKEDTMAGGKNSDGEEEK